jgi:acyl carrier protein
MSDASLEEVTELILRVLEVPADRYPVLERRDIAEWDSLKHMELVFCLEERFDVQFAESEFMALTSPFAILSRIRNHLAS